MQSCVEEFELFEGEYFGGDESEDGAHAFVVAEDIGAESSDAFECVCEVGVVGGAELLLIFFGHDLEEHFGGDIAGDFVVAAKWHD